jgi:hypothetical protein
MQEELTKYYREKYKEIIESPLDGPVYTPTSDISRITKSFQLLKYLVLIPRTGVTTLVFKATYNGTTAIYANIHAFDGKYQYISTGPTYSSQDGEYRGRLISWEQFKEYCAHYENIIGKIEDIIAIRMQSKMLTLTVEQYGENVHKESPEPYLKMANETRAPILLFALCWATDYKEIHFKYAPNHMNPAYQYVIYEPAEAGTFQELYDEIEEPDYSKFVNHGAAIWQVTRDFAPRSPPICGQKIIPVTEWEAVHIHNINYSIWREVNLTMWCSDLTLNLITPAFSLLVGFFFIENSHASMFDNISMHKRYELSEEGKRISDELEELDESMYDVLGIRHEKFYNLSRSIKYASLVSSSDIVLTDLSLCITSEYVGKTVRDVPTLILSNKFIGNISMIFTHLDIFTKAMFEFVFALFCMNSKLGVIHGDIHLNNVTFKLETRTKTTTGAKIGFGEEAEEVYMAKGSAPEDTPIMFRFRHVGCHSCIIDMSRAIVCNNERVKKEFGALIAEQLITSQRNALITLIQKYMPDFAKTYRDELKIAVMANFPLVFKAATVLDPMVLMTNIHTMIQIDPAFDIIQLPDGAVDLLQLIILRAKGLFTSNMQKIFLGDVEDIEWPNFVLMSEIFPQSTSLSADKVVNVFNAVHDPVWSIGSPDMYGPLLSLDKEIELIKTMGLPEDKNITAWQEFRQRDETAAMERIESEQQAHAHRALRYEQWMLQ